MLHVHTEDRAMQNVYAIIKMIFWIFSSFLKRACSMQSLSFFCLCLFRLCDVMKYAALCATEKNAHRKKYEHRDQEQKMRMKKESEAKKAPTKNVQGVLSHVF